MEKWTLEEVENSIQAQLDFLSKGGKDGDQFEADWLPCYTALAQVKQAQALERIEKLLRAGIPIERV